VSPGDHDEKRGALPFATEVASGFPSFPCTSSAFSQTPAPMPISVQRKELLTPRPSMGRVKAALESGQPKGAGRSPAKKAEEKQISL